MISKKDAEAEKRESSTHSSDSESHSLVFNSLKLHGLSSLWDSPGQNTGVGSLSLLQGIFPTQGLTQVSHIVGRFFFFTSWATREAPLYLQ